MAEKHAARPMFSVPCPVKYQWWPVPMIPAARKRMASRYTIRVAVRTDTRPSWRNITATSTVAKSSKKPSTQR